MVDSLIVSGPFCCAPVSSGYSTTTELIKMQAGYRRIPYRHTVRT